MKLLRSFAIAIAVGVASISAAQAGDSFSIGINIGDGYHGGYPQHHVISHHVAPQAVYYQPVAYYYDAPRVYRHAPVVVERYYHGESRHHRDWGGHSREHHRGHH